MIRMNFQPHPRTLRLSGVFEKRDFTRLLFGGLAHLLLEIITCTDVLFPALNNLDIRINLIL